MKLAKFAHSESDAAEGKQDELEAKQQTDKGAPTLEDVMEAIQGVHTAPEHKIDTVSTEVTLICADLRNMGDRVKVTEESVSTLQHSASMLETSVRRLQAQAADLEAKLEDYEGHVRRNNVQILGVPERAEGQGADLFVEDLIQNHLQPRTLSKYFSVERAHRVPGGPSKPGAPPRPILARIFNFRDRDIVLQTARAAPPLKFENSTITFFPDFTYKVQQKHRSFLEVKRALRGHNLKYAMLFSAKL